MTLGEKTGCKQTRGAHLHILCSSGGSALTKGPMAGAIVQDRQILEELANILEDEDRTLEDELVCSSVARVWKSRFIPDHSTKPDAAASLRKAMSKCSQTFPGI